MAVLKKSAGIPTQYEAFERMYDNAWIAVSRGMDLEQAKRLGLEVVRSGEFLGNTHNEMNSRLSKGMDFEPTDPRYNATKQRRPNGPDIPRPEPVLRDDQYRPRVKPGI